MPAACAAGHCQSPPMHCTVTPAKPHRTAEDDGPEAVQAVCGGKAHPVPQDDDVGHFRGSRHPSSHGNPDICLGQGSSIIDAIPNHGHTPAGTALRSAAGACCLHAPCAEQTRPCKRTRYEQQQCFEIKRGFSKLENGQIAYKPWTGLTQAGPQACCPRPATATHLPSAIRRSISCALPAGFTPACTLWRGMPTSAATSAATSHRSPAASHGPSGPTLAYMLEASA